MKFMMYNFIELNQFPDIRKVNRISPIPKINQPTELKIIDLYQFSKRYQKFMKGLFWNKLPN